MSNSVTQDKDVFLYSTKIYATRQTAIFSSMTTPVYALRNWPRVALAFPNSQATPVFSSVTFGQ